MKNFVRYITLSILMLFLGTACSKDYLIVKNPNSLLESSFWQTQNDAWMALNTCYNPLAFGSMYGNNWFLLMNSFEDRILFESTNLDNLSIDASNGTVSGMYSALYVGVWRCSDVIKNLQTKTISDLKEEDKKLYIAQAKALRAMYYFYQVVLFRSPYFYDETSMPANYNQNYGNSEPRLFWEKIKEDCQAAIPDLPATYAATDLGRITSGAANALLGKAMLFKHYHYYAKNGNGGSTEDLADLEIARQALNTVISSGTYHLMMPLSPKSRKDYLYAFGCNFSYLDLPVGNNVYQAKNNSESVWEVQYDDERFAGGWLPGWQWTGALNEQYLSPHTSSYKNEEFNPSMWYAFETAGVPAGFDRDPRAYATCYIDGDSMDFRTASPYYKAYVSGANNKKIAQGRGLNIAGQPTLGFGLKKYFFPVYYEGANAPKNDPVNIRLIRFSDVMLMYSEVMFLLGDDGTGLAQLNNVRARVDMPPIASLTRDAIMHERDVELAQEGHRFLDLIRWSFDPAWNINWYQIYGASVFTVGKNEYLPIPIGEISLNHGALKQNPGW